MKDYWKKKKKHCLSFVTERYTSRDIDYQSIKGRKERSGREEDKIRIIVINSAFLSCHCFEVSYLKDHFLFLTKEGHLSHANWECVWADTREARSCAHCWGHAV